VENARQRTLLFLIADTGAGHRSAANAISNALKIIAQEEQAAWQAQRQAGQSSNGTEVASGVRDTTEIANVAFSTVPNDTSGYPVSPALQSEQALGEAGVISLASVAAPPPPTYRIEIVDVFEEYSRFPLREAMKLYGPTIRYNPKLFGEFFHLSNREDTVAAVNTLAWPLIHNGLLRLFTTVQPDVIVSIHPLLTRATVRAIRTLGIPIPFITVVTDLVSIHQSWFAAGAEGYVVPTEEAKQLYLQHGLDPKSVYMLGMPIDPKFTHPIESKQELRRRFGLRTDLPVVLLVGGGDGAGGLQTAVRAISHARLPVQLLVVTGRNRRLYAHLQRTRASLRVPAKIFGFVQNMPELMHASDVIVTKAGPGTISEALACNLPIVLSGYVPGQEEGNVDYVVKNKVGVMAHDPLELVDAIRRYIKPGSPELKRQQENAKRLSRPWASFDIARCILSYLPAPEAESVWQSSRWLRRRQKMTGRLRAAFRLRRFRRRLPARLFSRVMKRRLPRLRIQGLASPRLRLRLNRNRS
jgi:1,2-diacylglycerol 3-beta-galactosyltransferase